MKGKKKYNRAKLDEILTDKVTQEKYIGSFQIYNDVQEICIIKPKNAIISGVDNQRVWRHAIHIDELLNKNDIKSDRPHSKTKKTSNAFETHSRDMPLAERLKREYLDKLPDQHEMHKRIVGALQSLGLNNDQLEVSAYIAVQGEIDELSQEAWSRIPTFKEEKQTRGKWNIQSHYKTYWKPWADAGVLFRDVMGQYDSYLVQRLSIWCSQQGLDTHDYLPPKASARVDRNIENFDKLSAEKAAKTAGNIRSRDARGYEAN